MLNAFACEEDTRDGRAAPFTLERVRVAERLLQQCEKFGHAGECAPFVFRFRVASRRDDRATTQCLRCPPNIGDRAAGPHEANLFDMDAKYGDVVSEAETLAYLNALGQDQ